jgi:TolA-binding protein
MVRKVPLQRVFVLSIFTILMILIESQFVVSAVQLKIEIWSDKDEYLTREPISVHYRVKNVGDEPAIMIFHALKGDFRIEDQQGKVYPNTASFSYGFISDTLKPNESVEGSEGIDARYAIVKAGEYTCYLQTPPWIKAPITKSNQIIIKVNDPEGEEKKALELYLEAEELSWCKDKDPQKWELGFQKYQELVDKYPKSVYAPQSLYAAMMVYLYSQNLDERRKIFAVCKRLIEEYPNSGPFMISFTELVDTYKTLKDKQGAIKTMKELMEKHPNTKISEEAERRLEQIEKWKFE